MSPPPSDNSQPDSVNLSNEENLETIVRCIRNNDKYTLRRLLEICKKCPFPLQAIREETPLHVAASKPEYKECLALLLEYSDSLKIDINDPSSYWSHDKTALQIACRNGCDESVLMLLQKQCDVDLCFFSGDSPLHIAAEEGHVKITQYLLDYGARTHSEDYYGSTPLHQAALYGYLEVARILIEKEANIRSKNFEGEIPLSFACQKCDYNMIRLLVEHDSSTINNQNFRDVTPLMVASENSPNEQCVRFLHENGASFSCRDLDTRLALHYAAKNGNVDVLRYVLEHTDATIIQQYFEDIPCLLRGGMSVDSLICCAIDSGNIECLEILLASNKLSTDILQVPRILKRSLYSNFEVYSPLTLIFSDKVSFASEKLDLFLRFLLEHNLTLEHHTYLDGCFAPFERVLPVDKNNLHSPFTEIFSSGWPFSKQQYYIHWLNTNGITVDYCLHCYYDNTRSFYYFNDYIHYYKPAIKAVLDKNVESLKLMMSTSAILEPDKLIVQMNRLEMCVQTPYVEPKSQCHVTRMFYFDNVSTLSEEEHCNMYKYLISLKPIYHTHAQLHYSSAENDLWFPCYTPNASQEFAESTLKQLCRTTIRQHLRKDTLEANLRDFRRNILELPLPPSLKDYLLFKS